MAVFYPRPLRSCTCKDPDLSFWLTICICINSKSISLMYLSEMDIVLRADHRFMYLFYAHSAHLSVRIGYCPSCRASVHLFVLTMSISFHVSVRIGYCPSGSSDVKQVKLSCVTLVAHEIVDKISDILKRHSARNDTKTEYRRKWT